MKTLESTRMTQIEGGRLCKDNTASTITGLACASAVILIFTPFAPLSGALAVTCGMGFTCAS